MIGFLTELRRCSPQAGAATGPLPDCFANPICPKSHGPDPRGIPLAARSRHCCAACYFQPGRVCGRAGFSATPPAFAPATLAAAAE